MVNCTNKGVKAGFLHVRSGRGPTGPLIWPMEFPVNQRYFDVFGQRGFELEEKEQVFWSHPWMTQRRNDSLSVVELGFGLGLNLSVGLSIHRGALRFVSVEEAPVSWDHISLAPGWRTLSDLGDFIHWYEHLTPGWNTWQGEGRRGQQLVVELWYGDVADFYPKGPFDCAFLDGHSPDLNPAMWDEQLLKRLSELVRRPGWMYSYTVKGTVKRALTNCGAVIHKRPGIGKKREVLAAEFRGQ